MDLGIVVLLVGLAVVVTFLSRRRRPQDYRVKWQRRRRK